MPGIFAKGMADDIVNVEDEEAYETARRLARQEGLFVGMSSGAAVARGHPHGPGPGAAASSWPSPRTAANATSPPRCSPKRRPPPSGFTTPSTRTKEAFEPPAPGEAALFVDGPALNAHLSLGVARRLVLADLLAALPQLPGLQGPKSW